MAILNSSGILISYECSDLIDEVKIDMQVFRRSKKVWAYCEIQKGVKIITEYSFDEPTDVEKDEWVEKMTLAELLAYLMILNNPVSYFDNFCDLFSATGWTINKFSEYFSIPERTVQDWLYSKHPCPEYLLKLMNYKLYKEGII